MKTKYVLSAFLKGLICTDSSKRIVNVLSINDFNLLEYKDDILVEKYEISLDLESNFDENDDVILETVRAYYEKHRDKIQNTSLFGIHISDHIYVIKNIIGSQRFDKIDQRVNDKIALVTGAAQGLGRGIAESLIDAGALVYIADVNEEKVKSTAQELCCFHEAEVAHPLAMNCANEDSVKSCADFIMKEVGGLDIVVSNAGILTSGSVEHLDYDSFKKMTDVNYHGYFLLVKHFSLNMKFQFRANQNYFGDVIQINSKSGLVGSNKNSGYAGSKFGGIGLTQSFALELINFNIKVNSICPGNFYDGPLWSDPNKGLFKQYLDAGKILHAKTIEDVKNAYIDRTPIKRGCTIEDVFKGLLYLLEQKYETGQALPITGGQVMLN